MKLKLNNYSKLYNKNVASLKKTLFCVRVMVFNTTFNNISVISWSDLLGEGGNLSTWRKPLTNFIT